jgi:hypothetical protein
MVVSVTGYEIGTLIFTIIIIGVAIKTSFDLTKKETNGRSTTTKWF